MTSARTAEYYLVSVTEPATLNENNFNLPNIPNTSITNITNFEQNYVAPFGQKIIDAYKRLPPFIKAEAGKITKLIGEEVIRNIFEARSDQFAAVKFSQGIPRFQQLQFRLIDVIKKANLIENISKLNISLFADLEEYLVNNPNIFPREMQSGIIEIIHLLRNYEIEMKDLVLHRKEDLQHALEQLDAHHLDAFLRAVYGPYLVITCVYVYLKLREKDTRRVRRVHLYSTIRAGRLLAEEINTHFEKIKKLIKPLDAKSAFVFPEHVKSYMSEQKLGNNAEVEVSQFLTKLHQYLKSEKLDHDIAIDLFVDTDDSDWKGIKIILKINQDLKTIYEKVKPKAYSFKRELPKDIAENLLIQFI